MSTKTGGPALIETIIQDQRAEMMQAFFDIMDPKWLKRLIDLKPFVWASTLALPYITARLPLLKLLPPYVMANMAPQFFDELKKRAGGGAAAAKKDGKEKEAVKTTIREAIGTLNKGQLADEFLKRLKSLGETKRDEFLDFQMTPTAAKGWIVFLSIIKETEFENGIELLMKTKPVSATEPKKIQVLVELTKGLYPNLAIRLREMGADPRNKIISQIEAMTADEALGYMVRLDAMEKNAFDEHMKMQIEGHALSLLTGKLNNVRKVLIDFHQKQKPGNPDTFFAHIKREFNRGRAMVR